MFSGEYEIKLDDKGRMILPSRLREDFQGGLYLTKGQEGCLFVYTSAYFNDLIANMDAASLTTAEQRAYLRLFLSGAKNELPRSHHGGTCAARIRQTLERTCAHRCSHTPRNLGPRPVARIPGPRRGRLRQSFGGGDSGNLLAHRLGLHP